MTGGLRLRSLRNRLAVVFGLIVLGAIGTVYLSVTPRLEDRLRNQRLSALAVEARRTAKDIPPLPTTPSRSTSTRPSPPDSASRSPRRSRPSASRASPARQPKASPATPARARASRR